MFFKISVLFSIFQVILATDSTNGFNFTDSQVISEHIYDDDDLKAIQQGLNLMQTMNENLRLKIDLLEMTFNQQKNDLKKDLEEIKAALVTQKESINSIDSVKTTLIDIRGELRKDFEELKAALTTQKGSVNPIDSVKADLIDIRGELSQLLAIHKNDWRKDFEELKAALTTQKASIEPIDSEKVKLNDIRGELNQQLTSQKNEFKNYLEELKAALTSQKESIKSIDTIEANLIDIRGELSQLLTTQKNESRKDFDELKATTMVSLPKNCTEALKKNGRNGIYKIEVPFTEFEPFNVYCLKDVADSTNYTSAWLVIQRRQDGSVDFYRNWTEYQQGFGNLEGEFFIGLNKLHALTQTTLQELWIQMEDFEGIKRWAKYSSFAIGGENELYALKKLGNYTGDAGDSLSFHKGMKWSTFDSDNDNGNRNCAENFSGAWWYKNCHESNLNGQYLRGTYATNTSEDQYGKGIDWKAWHGYSYSLKYVQMAIRPIQ